MLGFARAAVLALLVFATACKEQPAVDHAEATPAPAGSEGLIAGTPAGDLPQWAAEARQTLKTIGESLEADRASAHKQVLDLYVSRQEYMEMYYGPNGRMQPEAVLADAVKLAETRFHELMRATGATPPAPIDSIRGRITALDEQLGVVLSNSSRSAKHLRSDAQ